MLDRVAVRRTWFLRAFLSASFSFLAAAVLVSSGCSSAGSGERVGVGDGDGDGDGYGAYGTGTATITGRVWAPGNAPGMVPDGHEIPVVDAAVFLTQNKPAPMHDRVICEPCVNSPSSIASAVDGSFTIPFIREGTYWLVIRKGDFRREQEIVVGDGATIELTSTQTVLPSKTDPANGMWIPKIALAAGEYDSLQDILGKMGIGSVGAGGSFLSSSAAGHFDFYSNGGNTGGMQVGGFDDLVNDLEKMLSYDIIFIPCSGNDHVRELKDKAVLKNLRDYVAAGGKLYVTDWSGEWVDGVFPEQIEFAGSGVDTPASAYDADTGTWDTSKIGSGDGSSEYDSDDAAVEDNLANQWLDGQVGPTSNGSEKQFDASDFSITGSWTKIKKLHSVVTGVVDGNSVIDKPRVFVGDDHPLMVTYEPAGCGRVLYSTYHTTDSTHRGLVPQERMMVYLIMEIGVCKNGFIVD